MASPLVYAVGSERNSTHAGLGLAVLEAYKGQIALIGNLTTEWLSLSSLLLHLAQDNILSQSMPVPTTAITIF